MSTALTALLNDSSRFKFQHTRQKSEADLAIIDWRNLDTSNYISTQAKAKQLDFQEELPVLIIAVDGNELFSMLESYPTLDFSRVEFVSENEIGSRFLDVRIMKLLISSCLLYTSPSPRD